MTPTTFIVNQGRLEAARAQASSAALHLGTASHSLLPTEVRESVEAGYTAAIAALAELALAYNANPDHSASAQSYLDQVADDLAAAIGDRRAD